VFWFFVGPALLLAIFALRGERERAQFVAAQLAPDPDARLPAASVIVSIGAPEPGLRENLAALASLDYPDYELMIAARSAADIPAGVLPSKTTVVLGGSRRDGVSERIQDFAAGARATRKRSEILAFADASGHVPPRWLRALVRPLTQPDVGASTGFRWYTPEPPGFWPLLRSVWNAPIAGMLGPGGSPFLWEGAMAMRKERFSELRVPELWKEPGGGICRAGRRVREAGLKIAFAPGALVSDNGGTGMLEFFRQAGDEMAKARVCHPRLWWGALAAHFFYCGAMAASITASVRGFRGAEWALVAQLGLGILKGVNRAALAKVELSGRESWFERHAWVHGWWTPLATWVWLVVLLSSAFGW
jgi:ceramide glucosyltransferase